MKYVPKGSHQRKQAIINPLQLSEAVSVQSPNSPTMAPVGEDDPQGIPDSALAMQENTSEVAVLNQRLTSLERDNDILRASCSALQAQLDQVSLCSFSTTLVKIFLLMRISVIYLFIFLCLIL